VDVMMRRVVLAAVSLAGIVCGVVAAAAIGGSDANTAVVPTAVANEDVPSDVDMTSASTTTRAPDATLAPAVPQVLGPLLVWTTGGLPEGFEGDVSRTPGVRDVTAIRGDDAELTASWDAGGTVIDHAAPGWFIPLDALAVDPESYARVVPGGEVVAAALAEPDAAVIGETSATQRRIGVGGTLELNGARRVTIRAVVPDDVIAAAELVVSTATGAEVGVTTPRAILLRYERPRAELERAIAAMRGGRGIRFRERGETAYLRHGDAVLPQALIKLHFGEFAARHAGPTRLELDPAWVAANIVDVDLPVLGHTRCHRLVVPALLSALDELAAAGLTSMIDPSQFGGCYMPRLIGMGLGLSRHSWGVAIDVNVAANPLGGASTQDPRLVEIMRRWGMAWGGEWLRPDPMHFEYLTSHR
jgi:hypothetical protein